MNLEEKQFLADSYANAWMAVKGGTTTVTVLDHGWYEIRHSFVPYPQKVRSSKLISGLAVLTKRLLNKDVRG